MSATDCFCCIGSVYETCCFDLMPDIHHAEAKFNGLGSITPARQDQMIVNGDPSCSARPPRRIVSAPPTKQGNRHGIGQSYWRDVCTGTAELERFLDCLE